MAQKTTSIKIDVDLWKDVKLHCVKNDMDISDYLEKLIRKDLKIK